jgi:hypothetical protein
MRKESYSPYVVTSARFDGHGRGFCVGFDSRKAADYFATFVLFGFAEVLEWWQFENRFPDYKNNDL